MKQLSGGKVLMTRCSWFWFQICGAAEEKARFSFWEHSDETGQLYLVR